VVQLLVRPAGFHQPPKDHVIRHLSSNLGLRDRQCRGLRDGNRAGFLLRRNDHERLCLRRGADGQALRGLFAATKLPRNDCPCAIIKIYSIATNWR
jgi:hypothetical protein